jgi:ADP-heptose:LPS heptosyltransferase
MDLVITVDTLAAHLASALGRPAWVMLQFAADWRWMIDRTDSPWYPALRLFRQHAPNDWESVIEMIRHALQDWLNRGAGQ